VGREHVFPRLHDALAAYHELQPIPSPAAIQGQASKEETRRPDQAKS